MEGTFLSEKYAPQLVTEIALYLAGYTDGDQAKPPQMGAFPAYRAGWIAGVENA